MSFSDKINQLHFGQSKRAKQQWAIEYRKAYTVLYSSMIFALLWTQITASTIGVDSMTIYIVIGIPLIVLLWGYYQYSALYPGSGGFWSRLGIIVFGVLRVGWDQPGLRYLPWNTIIILGGSVVLLSPPIVQVMYRRSIYDNIIAGSGLVMSFIGMTLLAYIIGYSARYISNRFK